MYAIFLSFFFFFRSGVGSLSLSLVFVFRLELFALSQPDICFQYLRPCLTMLVLQWTRGMSESSNF